MSAAITRRALVVGAGAALGAAALPAIAATAPVFDPAAFVSDLKAIGLQPYAFRLIEGGILGPWRYGISAPPAIGFGDAFDAVAARWRPAMKANPDHGDRVAAFIAKTGGW